MTTRRERVILDLDPGPYVRGMAAAQAATAGFLRDLDTGTDRATNLTQSVLAIAPALAPLGGAGLSVLGGLTTQLGFAAAGAGVTALAFNGIGDALTALNEYQMEPSIENAQKLQEELAGLGPEARDFVAFLDEITPKLQRLREESQGELLPGVQGGLDALLERLPQVRRIISEVADASGDIARSTGTSLASDDWDEFFAFLETEARPNLIAFAQTTGNIFETLANTWMAFDPASDQFSGGLLDWSEGLADASENLDESEGFQRFLSYLQENGPKAVDLLGSLGGALLSIIEAAAPVGSAALPILTSLADALSVLAESPAGPVLIGAAAGISAVSRAVALFNAANGSALLGFLQGSRTAAPGAATGLGRMNTAISGLKTAAPIVAGLGLAFTDLDDKIGLSNTAMFTLLGLAAGPWGAAVGGAVGVTMDLAAANDDLVLAIERADRAIESMNLEEMEAAQANLNKEYAKQRGFVAGLSGANLALGSAYERLFGVTDEAEQKQSELSGAIQAARGELRSMGGLLPTVARQGRRFGLAVSAQAAALRESRKEASETAREFITLGDSLDDSKVSFRGWLRELERQAEALRNFRLNAERAANRGLRQGLIAALREAGPEGAMRMRQLANATDEELARANRAWAAGQREIGRYTDAVGGVPEKKATTVEAYVDPALQRLAAVRSSIDSIQDKSVTITTNYQTTGSPPGSRTFRPGLADGGTIMGQRYPYGDRLLIGAAPTEEMISNRYGQADKWRPVLKTINSDTGGLTKDQLVRAITAQRYADGGTIGGSRGHGGGGVHTVERVVELPRSFQVVIPGMGKLMAYAADQRIDNRDGWEDRWADHD